MKRYNFVWSKEHLDQLGKYSDRQLARQWGICQTVVWKKRKSLGIPPLAKTLTKTYDQKFWHKGRIAELGKKSDAFLAALWQCSISTVRGKRLALNIPPCRLPPGHPLRKVRFKWTLAKEAALGKKSDSELAQEWGTLPTVVGARRRYLKIPACPRYALIHDEEFWTPERIAKMGQYSDATLAKEWGTDDHQVFLKRKQLGIISRTERHRQLWQGK